MRHTRLLTVIPINRVMSGVITGPHFLKYFHEPKAVEVGTMVAVIEVGAFGMF